MTSPLENLLGVGQEVEEPEEVEETETEENEAPEDEELGDKGKKALDAMKQKDRETRAELRKYKKELEALKAGKNEDDLKANIRKEVAKEFGLELAKEKAKSLLTEAGYQGNLDRGVRSLERDLNDVMDDSGKVDKDALADLVADWKEDEPSLFRRSRNVSDDEDDDEAPTQRRQAGNSDLGKKRAEKSVAKDPLEQLLQNVVGRNQLA